MQARLEPRAPDARTDAPGDGPRAEWPVLVAVFAAGLLVVLSRHPDALLHPQFQAEDGNLWFADAHEIGAWRTLFLPSYRGYLHLLCRVSGALAQGVPLLWAPLVMNAFGAVWQALPAVLLASSRFSRLMPSRWVRLLAAFVWLGLPGLSGMIANTTYAQWHATVLACLVVLAAPAAGRGWRAFDVGAVTLSGLTGPAVFFLVPVAAATWWVRRERWTLVLGALLAVTAAAQAGALLTHAGENKTVLGASAAGFARIVARRVVCAALFGANGTTAMIDAAPGLFESTAFAVTVALAGALVLLFAAAKGPPELRLLVALGAATLCAGLAWPPSGENYATTYWRAMEVFGDNGRYFFMLAAALLASLGWMCGRKEAPARAVGALGLLVALAFGVRLDWREPPDRDFDFPSYVRRYDEARPGETIAIPYPPNWGLVITKR